MEKYYKLSEYAKRRSVTYKTAWTHFKQGLIDGAFQDAHGHVYIREKEKNDNNKCAIYARVSSNDRKESLNDQIRRVEEFANLKGYEIVQSYKEIASGMNDNRPQLNKILESNEWSVLLVENKNRLTRFGFNYIKTLLEKQGKRIEVMNSSDDDKQDLMKDLISVIYSFSARMYGLHRRKNRQEIIDFIEK